MKINLIMKEDDIKSYEILCELFGHRMIRKAALDKCILNSKFEYEVKFSDIEEYLDDYVYGEMIKVENDG